MRIQGPERNVVGTIAGDGPGYVVVGAHHDTKNLGPGFVGANDGASGVAVVLELARSLPQPLPGPSVAIALFDAEEARGERSFDQDGTRGSRQYVRYAERGGLQGSPPLTEIRAMVLFDMVGDCDLQLPRESGSDEALYELFAEAAGGAPFEGLTGPISDDHVPFLAGRRSRGRPDRLQLRPGRHARRLLAQRRGHDRQGLPREPRGGRRGSSAGDSRDSLRRLAVRREPPSIKKPSRGARRPAAGSRLGAS